MSNVTFESGQYYTLSQIFTGENKIIIPDLQRDYCWGDNVWNNQGKKESELVSRFVENLFDLPSDANQTLGLIYGYESPKHHIQLCDGQQRITTLFLLIGLINRRTQNNKFQEYLISNEELNKDDREPYLQYGIRESTLYFLSDLVCNYFIKGTNNESIKKQDWYFEEYDLDASVQSMLAAIKIIDAILDEKANDIKDFSPFGDFILNNLQMLYYDMGNRTRGEETFVVINTTGEPLTATENLKPILLGKITDKQDLRKKSGEWEMREEWFWEKRKGAGHKKNIVADNGVREFFRWVSVLSLNQKTKDFKIELDRIREATNFKFIGENLDLNMIHRYFQIVQFLFIEKGIFKNNLDWLSPDESDKYINTQPVWFRLLPVIEYINRYGFDIEVRKIIRVKTFFKNLSRLENVQKNSGELLFEAIRIIKELPNDDIASVLSLKNVSLQILREEEKIKFELYTNSTYNRNELENRFWNAEEHKIWNGEILSLIKWSHNEDGFNIHQFDKFNNIFNTLFDYKDNKLDLVRRALLTRNLIQYPKQFKGYTNWSFCYKPSDWKVLIEENNEKFGKFLYELNSNDYLAVLNQMIANNPVDKKFDEFVKNPELLAYCNQKNIQWAGDKLGWILVKSEKTSGEHANLILYKLFIELLQNCFWNEEWGKVKFHHYANTCVFFDNKNTITIDIKYFGNNLFYIELFRKDDIMFTEYKKQLDFFAGKFKLYWEEENKRFKSDNINKNDLMTLLKVILNDTVYFNPEE